jgi:hypothetical protein
MIPILLLVTATFRPPAPTVGDLITIDFQQAVTLDRSSQYEIVSQRGSRVVIRTFAPRPFTISGRVGDVLFQNMVVPVHSVLKPRDNLAPAPLKPPLAEAYPRLPFVIMGIAAFLAVVAWTAVVLLERRAAAARAPQPAIPPAERFRAAVIASRTWSQLADALREYLAATTELGKDLTTSEVLVRTSSLTIAEILRQGDLEKFSPWGARPGDFAAAVNRALELLPREEEEIAA